MIAAWHAIRRMNAARYKWKYPLWVVDYAFNAVERVRVASRARPWLPRLANTLHLYPPGTVYWEDYPRGAAALSDCAYLLFLGGEAAGLAGLVHPRARYGRFLDPEGIAAALFDGMARIGHEHGERGFWRAQSLFCALIDRLHDSEPVEGETRRIGAPAPAAAESGLVQAAHAYLAGRLAEPVALADLARHLHVSVSTLSHRYREETGETPMGRLLRMRVNLAKAMIVKGQSLKAIADSTGFSDAFHLSKTFKRMEGLSPRTYLRNLRRADRRGGAVPKIRA